MKRHRSPVLCVVLVAMGAARAQSHYVVPPGFADRESDHGGDVAGFDGRMRQQVLLASSWMRPLAGKTITGIAFRRDFVLGKALDASRSRLTVRVSETPASVSMPSASFAANRGPAQWTTFVGTVALPSSGRPNGVPPWDARHSVRIPFSSAFVYSKDNLCIEIEGEPIAPPPGFVWSVDYASEGEPGTATPLGIACGEPGRRFGRHAAASARFLLPGGVFGISSIGREYTAAVAVLGTAPLPNPIPLDPIGAPGCVLYVAGDLALPARFGASPDRDGLSTARFDVRVPTHANVLGTRLLVQWVNLEGAAKSNRAGLTTSNAVDIRVGKVMPPGRIANVISRRLPPNTPFPAAGRVEVSRAPVIRFEYR